MHAIHFLITSEGYEVDKQIGGWLLSQLEKLSKLHPDWFESIVEKLMREDERLRWALVVGAYLDGEINRSFSSRRAYRCVWVLKPWRRRGRRLKVGADPPLMLPPSPHPHSSPASL